jgi:asparagine N-glycosylation enzyme membrane subunit Stt3
MEWIKTNTEPGARITSWWDYGHWINYFGDRNAVIRNEHASTDMIGAVADAYLSSTPSELRAWMLAHDSKYALFDAELILSGNDLGGKYGALNYLSCAYNNETTVAQSPGESACEADQLWETVYVSNNPCTLSNLTGKTGFTAYRVYAGSSALPDYPSFCMSPQDQNTLAYCRDIIRAEPAYCAGEVTLADGQRTLATYHLDQTYPNGDLKLNKALMQLPREFPATYHFGPAVEVTLFYTNEPVWFENGQVVSGYEDRKGRFYDSALYRAFFLNDLPGFRQVYASPDGAVKIFKME